MFIVKLYTLTILVFSGLSNFNCAMVQRSQEKQYQQSSRSGRQFRPILGSIVFLLAANLVAKGVLGLSAYSSFVPPPNVHGSLYLNFGQPNQGTHQQQVLPYTWTPIYNNVPYPSVGPVTTARPGHPLGQQQIINIHTDESPYADVPDQEYQVIKKAATHIKRDVFEPVKSLADILHFTPQHRHAVTKLAELKREIKGERTETITEGVMEVTVPEDVEVFSLNTVGQRNPDDEEITTIARQVQTTTTVPPITTITSSTTTTTTTSIPTTSTPTTSTPTTSTPTTSTTASTTPTTTRAATSAVTSTGVPTTTVAANETGPYNYTVEGYGPYTGNENVSLTTTAPPGNATTGATTIVMGGAMNTTQNGTQNATTPTYYYYPAGEYGPSNGNENISITYGPPAYPEPFFSSPEDHFLNEQHNYEYQHYGQEHQLNNFYEQNVHSHDYNHFPYQSQYNDIVNRFYNKYDYHYPAFYKNF